MYGQGGVYGLGVQSYPPVDRITHAYENITFPQLLSWAVISLEQSQFHSSFPVCSGIV